MSRVAESWQGEPRDLDEWLVIEEDSVFALLGREVYREHGHTNPRADHLMGVLNALAFLRDAPLSPRATLRALASGLRDSVGREDLTPEARRDAQVFLLHVERLLDWVQNG